MTWRMPRRELDDHGSIAEYVVILALEQNSLAMLQRAKKHRVGGARSFFRALGFRREHGVALDLLDDPGGAGKRVGVRNVIAVVVRQGEIGDVRGRVPE